MERCCFSQTQKSYEVSGRIYGLILPFLGITQLRVVVDGETSQDCPVNAEVVRGSNLIAALFLLYINDLHEDAVCNVAICVGGDLFTPNVIKFLIRGKARVGF